MWGRLFARKYATTTNDIIESFVTHPNWPAVLKFAKESKFECADDLNDGERAAKIAALLDISEHLVSYGGYRAVFSIGGYIVKVPSDPEGFNQNENERYLWAQKIPAVRKHMVPYVDGDKRCIVLGKAEVFDSEEAMKPYLEQMAAMHVDFKACGLRLEDCEVDRYDQYGLYEGRLVVLDLGECYFA